MTARDSAARGAALLVADDARVAAARRIQPSPDTRSALDRVAGLAARLPGVAAAQVSLLSDVQLVAGGHGLPAGSPGSTGPLDASLCTLTAASGGPVAIPDTRAEDRSRDLPPVRGGAALSYLGVPLYAESGHITGSLCVFHPAVHEWSPGDIDSLQLLARAVSTELELASLADEYRSDRLRWGAAAEAGGVGSFDWVLPDGPLLWDDRLVEMFGYDGEEEFGRSIADFDARLHPDDRERVTAALTAAIEARGEFESEYRICLPGGEVRWVQARGQTLADDAGIPTHLLGAAYDTTEVHDGQARTNRILEAMPSGFVSLDTSWRFTVLNGATERLLGRPRAELLGQSLWEAFPATVGSEFERAYRATVSSGEARTLEAYYPAPLDAWFDILCWPTPDGLSLFFTDVTDRVRSAASAAAASGRLAALAEVNADLVEAHDATAVAPGLPRRLVPALAQACIITLVDDSGRPRDVGSWHADPDQRGAFADYAAHRLVGLAAGSPMTRLLATGTTTETTTSRAAEHFTDPGVHAALAAFGEQRIVSLAIRARGRITGALTLYSPADELQDPDTAATIQAVADRIGLALDNSRLARARSELAEGLQRSLLTAPPQPDHGEIVVRYLPAAEAAQVGGDWYDAFIQPCGTTMLVIGDVAGHDTAAASAMAQLRGLLRGIAVYSNARPAEVLRGLDSAMQVLEADTLATAAVVRFEQTPDEVEQGTTRMVWANAGHPGPLVVDPDGRVTVLGDRVGDLMLGIRPETSRTEHTVLLDRDTTVLLYTDGLVERRGDDLDAGVDRLTRAVTELHSGTLDRLVDGVVARLVDGTPDDDVAVVAIRLHSQDRPRPAEAGPQHIPPGVPEPEHPAQ